MNVIICMFIGPNNQSKYIVDDASSSMLTSNPVSTVLPMPEVSVPGRHQVLVHLVPVVAEKLLPRLYVAAAEDPHDLSPPRMLHAPVAAIRAEAVVDLVTKAGSVKAGVPSDLQRQVYVVSVIAFNLNFVHIIQNLPFLKSIDVCHTTFGNK